MKRTIIILAGALAGAPLTFVLFIACTWVFLAKSGFSGEWGALLTLFHGLWVGASGALFAGCGVAMRKALRAGICSALIASPVAWFYFKHVLYVQPNPWTLLPLVVFGTITGQPQVAGNKDEFQMGAFVLSAIASVTIASVAGAWLGRWQVRRAAASSAPAPADQAESQATGQQVAKAQGKMQRKHLAALIASGVTVVALGAFVILHKSPQERFFAAGNDPEKLKVILQEHPELVDMPDSQGMTLLQRSAQTGKAEVVQVLLDHHANPNLLPKGSHETALQLAAGGFDPHSTNLVQLLLTHKAEVNARGANGATALHAAVFLGTPEVIEMLLAHGADPNARTTDGYTPLRLATMHAKPRVVETLVSHGADLSAKDDSGKTPLQYAIQHKLQEVAETLRKLGAKE